MRKIVAALAISLSISSISFGVLPPLYQTQHEIKAILESADFDKYLPGSEPIIDIHKNDHGYEVATLRHKVQAVVVYLPSDMPGPSHFRIEFRGQKIDREP
jgi:hypothetical protein